MYINKLYYCLSYSTALYEKNFAEYEYEEITFPARMRPKEKHYNTLQLYTLCVNISPIYSTRAKRKYYYNL